MAVVKLPSALRGKITLDDVFLKAQVDKYLRRDVEREGVLTHALKIFLTIPTSFHFTSTGGRGLEGQDSTFPANVMVIMT